MDRIAILHVNQITDTIFGYNNQKAAPCYTQDSFRLFLYHPPKRFKRIGKSSDGINYTVSYRFLTRENASDVGCDLIGTHHQLAQSVGVCARIAADEADDPFLHIAEIGEGLRRADNGAADSDGVDRHCRAWYDEGFFRRNRKGDADRMPAAEHYRDRRL